MADRAAARFGLFVNTGEMLGDSHAEVFDLALAQAELAERLGYHDVWVTEHHFIPFGINSSALTLAAFLLGRTRRIRVGTAVTLAPLYHPLQLAEQAAILDQVSGGRFDFGVGRGGYLREFERFGVPLSRWDEEVDATLERLLSAFAEAPAADTLRPRPLTQPHPPLFAATSSPTTLERAAAAGLPLLHYFATPVEARVATQQQYAAQSKRPVEHVHALIVLVTDTASQTRQRLRESLTQSFRDGDAPPLPQASNRHRTPDGKPADREQMAAAVAEMAIVGSPVEVAARLGEFIGRTGASRLVLFMEAIGDRAVALESVERFAAEVVPRLTADPLRRRKAVS